MSSQPTSGTLHTVVVVEANFQTDRLGLRSRIAEPLAGTPVLRRTLERINAISDVDGVVVVVPGGAEAAKRAARLAEGLGVRLLNVTCGDVPNRSLLRRRRKWAIHSWRGGIGQATFYDEAGSPHMLQAVQRLTGAQTLIHVPASAVLLDPKLTQNIIAWHQEYRGEVHYTFSATPPGLSPEIIDPEFIKSLIILNMTPGAFLAYRQDKPEADPVSREPNYKAALEVVMTPFRLSADTQRSFEIAESLVARLGDEAGALEIARTLKASPEMWAGRLPREVEVEITTRCQLRCAWCPRTVYERPEKEMSADAFARIVESLAVYDDVCLTFGGFGEPTLHPRLVEMIRIARSAGVFGIALETNGLAIDRELAEALVAADVDVVAFSLDAHDAERYKRLKGADAWAEAVRGVETLLAVRDSVGADAPLIVPRMVKAMDNDADWVPFFDHWFQRADSPLVRSFNDFAGQVEDRTPIHMTLGQRVPCVKLFRGMMILADGAVPVCGQDFRGRRLVGNAFDEPVEAIWRGEAMQRLRTAHLDGDYGAFELCQRCKDWFY